MNNKIYNNVKIGVGTIIDEPCLIGLSPVGFVDGERPLEIGPDGHIRSFTIIYAGCKIGNNFKVGHGVLIREDNLIGNNVSIGTNCVLEFGNKIGDGSRIHTGCFMEMTTIGKYVFVGPNAVFTDDPHPMDCPRYKDCKGGAIVEDYVRIGANCTILPGIRIGKNSIIGAGAVVVKDIPPDSVSVGNPAEVIKNINELKCTAGFFEKPYNWPPYIDEVNEK